jgi:N-carbamoylputrescine amidase
MTQYACVADREKNMQKAEAQIREMAAKGAKIICTQELFNGMYFPQTIDYRKDDWAEPVDGPTNRRVQELEKELDVVIITLQQYSMQTEVF